MTITAPTFNSARLLSTGATATRAPEPSIQKALSAAKSLDVAPCAHLVFIASDVEDSDILMAGLRPGYRAFALSNARSGVEQMADILSEFEGVESLHIVTHGSVGRLQLGTTQLTLDSLSARMDVFENSWQRWHHALAENAQVLLYGCQVAEGDRGQAFVNTLRDLLGVEVAASTSLVGAASKNGNWQLDYQTAEFQPAIAFSQAVVEHYPHTLPFDVTLQAESAQKSGVEVASDNPGSQGSYVDYQNPSNDFVEWTVNAPKAGSYKLAWRYANGDTNNRPLSFQLNGKTVNNALSFNGTGGWSNWTFRNQTVTLKAGVNKIRLRATGRSGANFDFLKVTEVGGSSSGGSNPPSTGGGNSGGSNTGNLNEALQAENAKIGGATIDSLNGGAQGGRYVDYKNASGDFIEWTVNAPTAGNHTLSWRYANGASNRPLALSVNGRSANNNLAFNGTGAWTKWGTQKQTVSLKAGVNKIRLQANGSSGANFDSLTVTKGGGSNSGGSNSGGSNSGGSNSGGSNSGGGNSGGSNTGNLNEALQAENAKIGGATIDSLNGGAQGGRYVDYKNASGDFIEWTVNAPTAGNHTLSWRYANGASNRPLALSVNGQSANNVAFNGTGAWTKWGTQKQTVSLKAGVNKIRLQANGSSGANIDSLTVTKGGSSSGGGSNPGGGNNGSGLSTVGVGKIEAEKMTLSGYEPENSSISSGKQVIWTTDSGTAKTQFVGSAGKYDLSVVYNDENDGKSPVSVRVDGKVVSSWTFNAATNSTIATTANTKKRVISGVQLNANSVIEIRGAKNQNEFARIDYLQVAKAGSGNTGGGASGKELRVLALGDSNTRGEGTPGGYRTQFWKRAGRDGVAIDFLGTRSGGPSALGDKDHQGQGGWAIPRMTSWVRDGNLARQNPEFILFMMGTNDANTDGRVSAGEIRKRLSTFIDAVSSAAPGAHLFVSSILPLDTPRGTATEARVARDFNNLIPDLIRQKSAQGRRVSFVNAGGSLGVGDINGDRSSTNDQNDGLHATAAGYNKLGDAWYNGVKDNNVWKRAVANQKGQSVSAQLVESDAISDPLTGNSRNNIIASRRGADTLTGGGGADTFTFQSPAAGVDIITDFDSNDTLQFSASGFGGDLVPTDGLSGADYRLGSNPRARDSGSTFLFNTSDRTLSFDVDGTGSGAAVAIATFETGYSPRARQIDIV